MSSANQDGSSAWKTAAAVAVGSVIVGGVAYVAYQKLKPTKNKKSQGVNAADTTPKIAVVAPSKKASNDSEEDIKRQGNEHFKNGRYADAVDCYSKAIQMLKDRFRTSGTKPSNYDEILSVCYQNRAATNEKLGKLEEVVEDCTAAIAINNRYQKAYQRRCRANEKLARYKHALYDVTVLCVMEGFQKQETIELADHILRFEAERLAKDMIAARGSSDSVPASSSFIESYLSSFCEDPIVNDKIPPSAIVDQEGWFEKARACLKSEDYGNVVKYCTSEIDSNGGDSLFATLLRATFALIQGSATSATRDFASFFTFVEQEKDRIGDDLANLLKSNAYIKRGSFHMQQGRVQESLADFDLAEAAYPNNADVYHHRGQMFLLIGGAGDTTGIDKAVEDFEKCLKLRPDFGIAVVQAEYANWRRASTKMDFAGAHRAILRFEKVMDEHSDCAEGYALLAQIYVQSQNMDEASKMFDEAIKRAPRNANFIVHKGLLHMEKENVEEALRWMERALRADPHCEFAYESIGTLEVQRGNFKQASEYFDRALNLCRTEKEMMHIFGLKQAADCQARVVEDMGIPMAQLAAAAGGR